MDVRILVVDDSRAVVSSLTHMLTGQGYQVESRGDGQAAWDNLVAAAEGKEPMPDLLLLDLNMPRMDGLTLLGRLRADERFALLPVIILTVEADAEVRLKALKEGANDYLPKPIQTIELLARVESLLGLKLAERRQQRRMRNLIEAGKILLSTHDLSNVLQRVMQIAMGEMNAENTSIWLLGSDGRLECRAAWGIAAEHLLGTRVDPGRGIIGWTLEHRESVLARDLQADPRFDEALAEQVGLNPRDLVSVPLLLRESCIGVLRAVNKRQETFSLADLAWMEVLASQAAAAIANAQLLQALRRRTADLQKSNEELDAFAHTVAHDLKNPLSHIVGFAETLEAYGDGLAEDQLQAGLQQIAQGGRKASRIVDELLLLAGVRRMEAEVGPLDMGSIVAEALERMADLIRKSEARVILPKSWPVALGYGPWVEEVWVNYISNAIKYGGSPPQVDLGATAQPDGMVRFYVRDNGAGLTPEQQAQIFTPFARLDQAHAKGHGLGLSIVHRIVEKLGGKVEVASKVGQGSVFSFTLIGMTDPRPPVR